MQFHPALVSFEKESPLSETETGRLLKTSICFFTCAFPPAIDSKDESCEKDEKTREIAEPEEEMETDALAPAAMFEIEKLDWLQEPKLDGKAHETEPVTPEYESEEGFETENCWRSCWFARVAEVVCTGFSEI